jgi:hypothetical protein
MTAARLTGRIVNLGDDLPARLTIGSAPGPTFSGLAKPDLIAPGGSISSSRSASSGFCNKSSLMVGSGTSPASAYAAGSALLVQQYFSEGFYRQNLSFLPDSSLVRAILVASADPITNRSRRPSLTSGHGTINLANVLTFDNSLKVDQKVSIGKGDHFRYQVSVVSQNRALRAAMAYLDYPIVGHTIPLIADLDMFIRMPNGTIVYGNMRENSREERFSTVERILLWPSELEMGRYEIDVVAHGDFSLFQNHHTTFSIAVAGPIDPRMAFEKVTALSEYCGKGTIGSNCQISTLDVSPSRQIMIVAGGSIEYFRVPCKDVVAGCRVSIARTPVSAGLFRYYLSVDSIPLTAFEYSMVVESNESDLVLDIQPPLVNHSTFLGLMIANASPNDFAVTVWADCPSADSVPLVPTPTPYEPVPNYYAAMMVAFGFVIAGILMIFIALACVIGQPNDN